MRKIKLPYDEVPKGLVGYKQRFLGDEPTDNNADRQRMFNILKIGIETELTDKQHYYLTEYYYKNKKMKDIAEEAGVNPSTVTRGIASAVRKLQKIAAYYDSMHHSN